MTGARRVTRRVAIWCAVAAVIGLLLGLVPLFGVLGFELALAMAFVAAVSSLDLGAALARALQTTPVAGLERAEYPGRAVARAAALAALLPLIVVAVPAVICAVRGLWVPTCDWGFGVQAYLAMPVATAVLGGALGFAIGCATGTRTRVRRLPHRSTVLALLVLPVLAAFGLYRFYAAPPVFTYSPVIGYFPGNLYDENVRIGATLWLSRLEQLLWLVTILAAVATRIDVPTMRVRWRSPRPLVRRIAPLLVGVACAVPATIMHLRGGALGYNVDAEDIEDELGGRLETAHFIIHYARTPEIEKDLAVIAEDHELRYAEVVAQLGVAPEGKLRSFYFADRDQKARWMGARDVEMAKPWRHEIYLDHRSFPHSSLRHEIAHAVASAFGDPVFGVAARHVLGLPVMISPGLVEGLAVAIDWPGGDYGRLTPHENVRALQAMGMVPSVRQLLSLGFLAQSSARSYQTAGSFLRFLLDSYGAPRLRDLYHSGGDFARVYGKPLDALEGEWREMLGKINLPPDLVEGTRERFRTGSVFARPCPHAIAARRERAQDAQVHGERARAISIMREVCKDAPEEPRHTLELGDMLVGGTAAQREEAVRLWTKLADDEHVTSTLRAEALSRLAAHAAWERDLARVAQLIARASALPVDPGQRRQLAAQTFALEHTGPAAAALRGYFFAPMLALDPRGYAQLAVLGEPELGFTHYLLGLQAYQASEWPLAAAELDRAIALGVPGIDFTRNAARKLAVAAYRSKDTDRVGRAIAALTGDGMATTDRLLAEDWQRRLSFDATGHL